MLFAKSPTPEQPETTLSTSPNSPDPFSFRRSEITASNSLTRRFHEKPDIAWSRPEREPELGWATSRTSLIRLPRHGVPLGLYRARPSPYSTHARRFSLIFQLLPPFPRPSKRRNSVVQQFELDAHRVSLTVTEIRGPQAALLYDLLKPVTRHLMTPSAAYLLA